MCWLLCLPVNRYRVCCADDQRELNSGQVTAIQLFDKFSHKAQNPNKYHSTSQTDLSSRLCIHTDIEIDTDTDSETVSMWCDVLCFAFCPDNMFQDENRFILMHSDDVKWCHFHDEYYWTFHFASKHIQLVRSVAHATSKCKAAAAVATMVMHGINGIWKAFRAIVPGECLHFTSTLHADAQQCDQLQSQ